MKHSMTYTSCLHTYVRYYIYEPKIVLRIKGVIQIHHGLCEHADRYEHFAQYFMHRGFVVVVSDFVGHGQSLIDFEQGYFGKEKGSDCLVKDMFRLCTFIRERYPDAPYFMLGTDLGAIMIRKFISLYGDYVNGVLLLGTSGHLTGSVFKMMYIKLMKLFRGPMHRSQSLFKHFHHHNNKKFSHNKSVVSYLTKDKKQLRAYLDDPMTHFPYTLQGYEDILTASRQVNSQEYIRKIPSYLSIYLACGEKDTMIEHADELYENYKKQGITDLTYKIFKDCRHALLFETERNEVYHDILMWLNGRTYV